MGELIAFKPARRCAPFRAAPVDAGTVVIFTGVRQERLESFESVTVKARGSARTKDSGAARKKMQRKGRRRP